MAAIALNFSVDQTESTERKASPGPVRPVSILLIEDSEEAMMLVRLALQDYGGERFRIEWANSLGSGLEFLSAGGIDLVLLDLGLPESSGAASYAWVRELAPDLPIVVLTGDERPETETAVSASGANAYLVKNQISGAILFEAIQRALNSHKWNEHARRTQNPPR